MAHEGYAATDPLLTDVVAHCSTYDADAMDEAAESLHAIALRVKDEDTVIAPVYTVPLEQLGSVPSVVYLMLVDPLEVSVTDWFALYVPDATLMEGL